ncbi:RecF/RecN/SMC N terminal domain-containing protein [Xylaria castorea]|nr:RecF/RecN/SMC N terminal domain-containing protein [Xylaria castorea]
MRVIEVIIDGFKSYAVRTVISGWDESFNSITGLNGSGKSNILDAICFVLGITNMSTVRAQNLQVRIAIVESPRRVMRLTGTPDRI